MTDDRKPVCSCSQGYVGRFCEAKVPCTMLFLYRLLVLFTVTFVVSIYENLCMYTLERFERISVWMYFQIPVKTLL